MALNFEGVGFSFAAKDDGLLAYQRQVLSGFDSIAEQVAKMGRGGGMAPPGGGGPGGGGPGSGMPDIPDPSKQMGPWAKFGATVKKSMAGVFSSTRTANKELFGMADVGHKLRAILGQLRLGNLLEGLSLSNLNQITDAVEKLGDSGRNLTTGLEAEFTSMNKTAKASFANLGYTGAEIGKLSSKASGMAKGLNLDVSATTEAIAAYGWASKEFAALGIMNEKDLAKAVAVTGINAKETAQTVRQLSSAYGFSDEQIQQLYSSSVALGQQTGDVGGAIGKLPALMDKLAQTTDRYGNVLKGAELAKFAQETLSVSAGFFKMGYSTEEAMSASEAFGEAISKGRKDYAGLFVGVGDQMPEFLQQMSIATGGFEDSFKLMQEGPDGFAQGMLGMVDKVRAAGGDVDKFVRTVGMRLESTLGADKAAMLQKFMLTADEGVLKVMADSKKASVTLGQVGKAGFSTGRTLAEAMQLAEDSMEMRFRKIGMGSTRTFVTDAQKNFKSFGDQMQGLASEGGPMGMVITKLSEISSQGATAFLPDSLKPAAALFGKLLKTMGPALGIMGSLGFRFSMLLSPLTALALPLGLLAVTFGDLVMKTYDAKKKTYDFAKAFDQLGEKVQGWIKLVPGYFNKFVGVLKTVAKWVKEKLPGILEQGFLHGIDFVKWLTQSIRDSDWSVAGTSFFDGFKKLFADGGAGDVLLQQLKALFNVVVPKIATLLGDLLGLVDWSALGKTVAGFLGTVWDVAFGESENKDPSPIAEALGKLIKKAWGAVKDLASGFWTQLTTEFGTGGAVALTAGAALAMSPMLRTLTMGAFQLALQGVAIPLTALFVREALWPALKASGVWMAKTAAPAVGGWIMSMFSLAMTGARIVGSLALSFGSTLVAAISAAVTSTAASLAAIGGGGIAAALAAGVATFFATKKFLEWTGLDKKLENAGAAIYEFFHGKEDIERTNVRGPGAPAAAPKFNMEAASKAVVDPKPWDMTTAATAATSSGMFDMMAAVKPVADGTAGATKAVGDFAAKTENAGVSVRDVNAAMSAMPMIFGKNKKKTEEYTKAFSDFVMGLKNIWYKGIEDMLTAMDLMVVAVQKDAANINADVARMTAALIEVQKEQEKTLSMTAAAGPTPISQMAGMEDLPDNFRALASVIDNPGWYARYEVLFALKMNELKAEMQRMGAGGGVAAPTRGPSASSGAGQTVKSMIKKPK